MKELDYFIKNKPIFDRYLKERGGLNDYDEIAHIKTHRTGRIVHDLFNGCEGFYLCSDGNKIHESDLIWCPQPNDLEKIIMKKMNFYNVYELIEKLYDKLSVLANSNYLTKCPDTLRMALAYCVVELEKI